MHKFVLLIGVIVAVDHFILDGELLLKQLRRLGS